MRALVCGFLLSALAAAQSAPVKVAFEVASVKPAAPADRGNYYYKVDGGRADMVGVSLFDLVGMAYRYPWDLVAPDWMAAAAFEIHGTFPAGSTQAQLPEMLQSLLSERFGLKIHHEDRTLGVYAMTVAKDGPKFRESPPGDAVDPGACDGGFRKQCRQVTMDDLAKFLSGAARIGAKHPEFLNVAGALDRPVVDMTGLKGKYTFEYVAGRVGGGRGANVDPNAEIISAFDGLKALGLKLEPAKHTFDVIVVDHIERAPTEN